MRKKVVFMIINMNIGGTERALLNLIAEMPEEKYDITILMLEKYGDFLESIPERVHRKYLKGYNNIKCFINESPRSVIKSLLKKGQLIKSVHLSYMYLLSKMFNNKSVLFKYVLKNHPTLTKEYDTAIAYAGPMDFISYFVVHKINAERKIQWIHFDVNKIGFNKIFASKIYKHFDEIYAVSNEGKNKLIQVLPSLVNKIDTFLNIISPKELYALANKGVGFTDHFEGIRILTVGRLSKEKGQDLVIPVMAKLKEKGLNIRWYCIGDGNAKEKYKELIRENKIENEFILMGLKTNPYPFMKQCDIYVQPSRHEGYCITLAEAKVFNKPIVCTNFTGATEQITNGETGLVINFDEAKMVDAIEKLITNSQVRNRLRNNLNKEQKNHIRDDRKVI